MSLLSGAQEFSGCPLCALSAHDAWNPSRSRCAMGALQVADGQATIPIREVCLPGKKSSWPFIFPGVGVDG